VSHSCEWKDAIIDACVVDWIFAKAHETDPRKAVNDLLCWQQRIALDPAVSKDAADLHARINELEAALKAAPPVRRQEDEHKDDLARVEPGATMPSTRSTAKSAMGDK